MDLNGLRRHDSVRKIVDRANDIFDGVAESVAERVEGFTDQQDGFRREKVAETLELREQLDVQAKDINSLGGRISEEPIIILGELDARAGTHVAAVITTELSQVKSGHESGDIPHVAFYKVESADLPELQKNPFKRYHQEDGVVAIGEYIEGESVIGWASTTRVEQRIQERLPQVPEQLLSPLGAFAVLLESGVAHRGMQGFEQSLGTVRSAMYDRELNPELVQLLGKPVPGPSA